MTPELELSSPLTIAVLLQRKNRASIARIGVEEIQQGYNQ